MQSLKVLSATVSAALALTFGSSVFAQQVQQNAQASQIQEQVQPIPQQAPQGDNGFGPAAIVINKLVTMQDNGKFPATQAELDRATEFLMAKAQAEGLNVTRDQVLVGMGYIAGSLATFMDIQRQAAEVVPQAPSPLPPEVIPAPNDIVPQPEVQQAPQVSPAQQGVQQQGAQQIVPPQPIFVPMGPGPVMMQPEVVQQVPVQPQAQQ